MTKKTLGELLNQQIGSETPNEDQDKDSDILDLRLSDALVQGTCQPSAVKKGLWLRIYAEANTNPSVTSFSRALFLKHKAESNDERFRSLEASEISPSTPNLPTHSKESQLRGPRRHRLDESRRNFGKLSFLRIKVSGLAAASIVGIIAFLAVTNFLTPDRSADDNNSSVTFGPEYGPPLVESIPSDYPLWRPVSSIDGVQTVSTPIGSGHAQVDEADRQKALSALESTAVSSRYAAFLINAQSGEVLYSKNADSKLHPASLTKIMTLYIIFDAIRREEVSLDTSVTISKHAASQPPSRLGLTPGGKIALRYLIRAVAVKSANDAAVAAAELVYGSELAFVDRMNTAARQLGMTKTVFRNSTGLTEDGQLSTARDLSILGQRILQDFPEYYNIFSRRSSDAGLAVVANVNRRFLNSYPGADGVMTGYTVASGFNTVASVERGGVRLIATVLGGTSSAWRNDHVAMLMDFGFLGFPKIMDFEAPMITNNTVDTSAVDTSTRVFEGKAVNTVVERSPRPIRRPDHFRNSVEEAITAAVSDRYDEAVVAPDAQKEGERWTIGIGKFSRRFEAERVALEAVLAATDTLDGSQRQIVKSGGDGKNRYEARLVDLSFEDAEYICQRMQQMGKSCDIIGRGM